MAGCANTVDAPLFLSRTRSSYGASTPFAFPGALCARCSCGSAPVPEDATAFLKKFPYRLRIAMSSIAVQLTTTPSGARYAYGYLFKNGIQRQPTAACTAAGFVVLCFELQIRFCELVVAIGAAGGRSTPRRRPTTTRLRAQSKFTISTSGDEVKRSHQTHAPNVTGALLVDGGEAAAAAREVKRKCPRSTGSEVRPCSRDAGWESAAPTAQWSELPAAWNVLSFDR